MFLEAGARKEGELVFYTSLSLTDYPKIMPYFEKAYPFIKTSTYRATPSGVFTRVDTEARAGRNAVDVVGSSPVEMWQLKLRKLSTAYLSPERKAMPAGSYDAEGYSSKAERLLGYTPSVSFEEGLGRTVKWYRESMVSKS